MNFGVGEVGLGKRGFKERVMGGGFMYVDRFIGNFNIELGVGFFV